jgi:hypothetical protein
LDDHKLTTVGELITRLAVTSQLTVPIEADSESFGETRAQCGNLGSWTEFAAGSNHLPDVRDAIRLTGAQRR